jgi:hypothetical protein
VQYRGQGRYIDEILGKSDKSFHGEG